MAAAAGASAWWLGRCEIMGRNVAQPLVLPSQWSGPRVPWGSGVAEQRIFGSPAWGVGHPRADHRSRSVADELQDVTDRGTDGEVRSSAQCASRMTGRTSMNSHGVANKQDDDGGRLPSSSSWCYVVAVVLGVLGQDVGYMLKG